MNPTVDQRGQGVMLGIAVGDLMGSPFEGYDITTDPGRHELFKGSQEIDPNHPTDGWKPKAAGMINYIRELPNKLVVDYIGHLGTNFWQYGETTDDTSQSVLLAESLVANKELIPADVAHRFVGWYDGGRGRGMGGTTALSLQLMDPEETNPPLPWGDAARFARSLGTVQYQGRHHSKPYPVTAVPSNGALMRVAPIGVWGRHDLVLRNQAAEDVTNITHAFDECVASSIVQTDIVADLMNGVDKHDAIARARARHPGVFSELAYAMAQPTDELGHTGGAFTTLGVAIDAFEQTDNFRDAIISTINSSVLRMPWMCDIDTYGAVAGALAGACYGVEAIPREWYELTHPDGTQHDLRPYSARHLRQLGSQLVRCSA